jgi:hypothetical protein
MLAGTAAETTPRISTISTSEQWARTASPTASSTAFGTLDAAGRTRTPPFVPE